MLWLDFVRYSDLEYDVVTCLRLLPPISPPHLSFVFLLFVLERCRMRRHRRTRHICSFTAHRRLLLPGHICRRLLVLLALSAYEWVTDVIFFF